MGSAKGMVAQAAKSIGLGESPANTNYITRWYGFSGAWCDMAITYWAHHSGNASAVCPNGPTTGNHRYAYTVWHAQAFQKAGRWHYGTAGIKRGDIIFYQWEGGARSIGKIDHVGLVAYVRGNVIHTIEGNRGDRCGRHTVVKGSSLVTGYGRPAYGKGGGGGKSKPKPPKKEKEEMPERMRAGWSGDYVLPADGKFHTLSLDKVYEDSYSQRAKNGVSSSTIMSSPGSADVRVHLVFDHLDEGGCQIRMVRHKGKKVVNRTWPEERNGTAGKSMPDGIFINYRNYKGRKLMIQVKNTSGKDAHLRHVNVNANIWPTNKGK